MKKVKPLSNWIDGARGPVDPEIFRRAIEVWQTGAEFALRKRPPVLPGMYLADIPMNRSAIATTGFLHARAVPNPQAYLWRLMHLYEVTAEIGAGGMFAQFAKPSDEDGAILISEALLDAVALAPLAFPPAMDKAGPALDLQEIHRLACVMEAEDQAGEGAA